MTTEVMLATWLLSGEYLPFVPLCTISIAMCILYIAKSKWSIALCQVPYLLLLASPLIGKKCTIFIVTQLCIAVLTNTNLGTNKSIKLGYRVLISSFISLSAKISILFPYTAIVAFSSFKSKVFKYLLKNKYQIIHMESISVVKSQLFVKSHSLYKENLQIESPIKLSKSISDQNCLDEAQILSCIEAAWFALNKNLTLKYSNTNGLQLINQFDNVGHLLTSFECTASKANLKEKVTQCFQCENVSSSNIKLNRTDKFKSIDTRYRARMYYLKSHGAMLIEITQKSNTAVNSISHSIMNIVSCSMFNELNNVLNGINGNIEMLDDLITSDMRSYYKNAVQFCKILSFKLRDYDDLSKIRNGMFNLHIKKFLLLDLLTEYKNAIYFYAELKRIGFSIDTKFMNSKEILSDYDRLLRVLINITYIVIESIQFGHILVKLDFPSKEEFDLCIIVSTQEKAKLTSLFQYKPIKVASNNEESPLQNFEGVSLVSLSYIAGRLGKGIECEPSASYILLHIRVRDGFAIEQCPIKAKSRKLSNAEGITEETSTITSTGRSAKRILNKAKLATNTSFSYLNNISKQNEYSKRKSTFELADVLDVADERGEIEFHSQTNIPRQYPPTQNKIIHQEVYRKVSIRKERKERANTFVEYGSPSLKPIMLHNMSNEDNVIFNAIIADDNFTNQYVLKGLLKLFKINSAIANNGEECVQMVSAMINKNELHYIKIIFMDLQMPVMNGVDATRKILELLDEFNIPRIPIIGVSSDNNENDKKLFCNSGISEFVEKPISKSTLERLLIEYIDHRK